MGAKLDQILKTIGISIYGMTSDFRVPLRHHSEALAAVKSLLGGEIIPKVSFPFMVGEDHCSWVTTEDFVNVETFLRRWPLGDGFWRKI